MNSLLFPEISIYFRNLKPHPRTLRDYSYDKMLPALYRKEKKQVKIQIEEARKLLHTNIRSV